MERAHRSVPMISEIWSSQVISRETARQILVEGGVLTGDLCSAQTEALLLTLAEVTSKIHTIVELQHKTGLDAGTLQAAAVRRKLGQLLSTMRSCTDTDPVPMPPQQWLEEIYLWAGRETAFTAVETEPKRGAPHHGDEEVMSWLLAFYTLTDRTLPKASQPAYRFIGSYFRYIGHMLDALEPSRALEKRKRSGQKWSSIQKSPSKLRKRWEKYRPLDCVDEVTRIFEAKRDLLHSVTPT